MGKTSGSSTKSKEAREARKAEQRRLTDCMRLVAAANKLPCTELDKLGDDLRKFQLDDRDMEVYCSRVADLAPELLKWAIDLTKRNMKKLYEDCAWGWDLRKKTAEMSEDEALYAVVRVAGDGAPVAFSHFRFDMDHGTPVLYCYELQVEEERRGRGVGTKLLTLLEKVAERTRMDCVRLTALRHNPRAAAFFRACGYTLDETSPDALDAAHYEILSKYVSSTTPAPAPTPAPAQDNLAHSLSTACTLSG